MSDAPIRTESLTERYGDVVGISEVDLEVRPGEVFGFLGPNGAGKTATIRLLLALLGVAVWASERRDIGT
ncbi:MAG: ATP-binding cassette domain-containing protein [Actinobacteria bacterium]|nr:ATP-binding cassette domain-containing protein [Actinomycetota bacterium]